MPLQCTPLVCPTCSAQRPPSWEKNRAPGSKSTKGSGKRNSETQMYSRFRSEKKHEFVFLGIKLKGNGWFRTKEKQKAKTKIRSEGRTQHAMTIIATVLQLQLSPSLLHYNISHFRTGSRNTETRNIETRNTDTWKTEPWKTEPT